MRNSTKYSNISRTPQKSMSSSLSSTKCVSSFSQGLRQRERDLRERKKKLLAAKERLAMNLEMLDEDRLHVTACFNGNLISSSRPETRKSSLISQNDNRVDCLEERIKRQLDIAAKDEKNKTGNSRIEENPGEKAITQSLQSLLQHLEEYTRVREREVADAELCVASCIQDRKAALQRRRDEEYRAEQLKKRIRHAKNKCTVVQEKNKRSSEYAEMVKRTLNDANAAREELKEKEAENASIQKAIAERSKLNSEIKERINKMQKTTAKVDSERREYEKDCVPDENDDPLTEQDVESMKREVDKAKDRLEEAIKRNDTLLVDTKAKAEIENMKVLLKAAREENKTLSEETSKSQKDDNDGLKQKVAEKLAEMKRLQSEIISDEELEARDLKLRNEQKALLKREREISARNSELRNKEDTIESDELTVLQTEDDLAREKKLVQIRNNNADKMLEIYKLQKKAVEKSFSTLNNKIVESKEKFDLSSNED